MNYYDILEISPKASQEVVNMAYKALVRKYHPDLNHSNPEFDEDTIKKINEAYEVLRNPIKRAEYDEFIKYENLYDNNSDEFQYKEENYETITQSISVRDMLFSHEGRIGRKAYFFNLIFTWIAFVGFLMIIYILLMYLNFNYTAEMLEAPTSYILSIPWIIIYFKLSIKRLHDFNSSGATALLTFVPLLNIAYLIYISTKKGSLIANDYGYPRKLNDYKKYLLIGTSIIIIALSFYLYEYNKYIDIYSPESKTSTQSSPDYATQALYSVQNAKTEWDPNYSNKDYMDMYISENNYNLIEWNVDKYSDEEYVIFSTYDDDNDMNNGYYIECWEWISGTNKITYIDENASIYSKYKNAGYFQ